MITWLELAKKLGVANIHIHCDSQLIVHQVKRDYTANEANMVAYLPTANNELEAFSWFEITQVPRSKNNEADALAYLTSGVDMEGLEKVAIETFLNPSISREEVSVINENPPPTWMKPIKKFMKHGELRTDWEEAKKWKMPQST